MATNSNCPFCDSPRNGHCTKCTHVWHYHLGFSDAFTGERANQVHSGIKYVTFSRVTSRLESFKDYLSSAIEKMTLWKTSLFGGLTEDDLDSEAHGFSIDPQFFEDFKDIVKKREVSVISDPNGVGEKKTVEKPEVPVFNSQKFRISQLQEKKSNYVPQKKKLLLFVHGYNNTFEGAMERGALFFQDLAIRMKTDEPHTEIAVFAWPSRGQMTGYAYDEESVAYTIPYFMETLTNLCSEWSSIDIVAHSMGNRVLVYSLENLLSQATFDNHWNKIKHLGFFAPDIDLQVFENKFSKISQKIQNPSTSCLIYTNPNDRAVELSQVLHKAKRLGNQRNYKYPPSTVLEAAPDDLGFSQFHDYCFSVDTYIKQIAEFLSK